LQCNNLNSHFEFFREGHLVQEDIGIMIFVVKSILDVSNRVNGIPNLVVFAKNDESRVFTSIGVNLVIGHNGRYRKASRCNGEY